MNNNTKIAKELVKLAKSLVAADEEFDGYEELKNNYSKIVNKVADSSEELTDDMAELENDAYCVNPMIVFYFDGGSTGISYVEDITDRESEEKAWMWWFEGSETEYHQFNTLEKALNDYVSNMSHVDDMIRQSK